MTTPQHPYHIEQASDQCGARDYRIEMIGDHITFVLYLKVTNEYDAKQEAKRLHPHFTVGGIVEVMPVMPLLEHEHEL